MKKFLCLLLALLLVSIQVCASAEGCYEFLKAVVNEVAEDCSSEPIEDEFADIADGATFIAFIFWKDTDNVLITGQNQDGVAESTTCTMDDSLFVAMLLTVCQDWAILEEQLDDGCQFTIAIMTSKDSEFYYISDEETAIGLYQALTEDD